MVKGQFAKKEVDPAEAALELYEREEKEFQNHWVWKELRCKPEEFFAAVKKHVAGMNIPKERWQEIYQKARQASRVRSNERRGAYSMGNLKLIGQLKV